MICSPDWGELWARMWPGWSVPANWGWRRMVGCLRSVWTSNLVSRRGCIFMLVAAHSQARRPTRVREKYCEASQSPVLLPGPGLSASLGLSWPTFIKLVSDSSPAPASTPTICPQTWLLLLFQAFTTFLYWSQRNFKMNKYELCHIIVLPCGDSFRIIDILVWWISNNSQT